ncbi:MAG: hypothetical protein R6X15_04975 [Pseudomonadota bacterium]
MPSKSVFLVSVSPLILCLAAVTANAADTSPDPASGSSIRQTGAEPNEWLPRDSDLRILEIRVDAYTLDDVIGAYQYQDVILLPLGGLAYLLDLAIDVDEGVAGGFVIREDNTFQLDTSRSEVILKGRSKSYPAALVKVLDDDIYVESALLGQWLDMALDIDLYTARIWVRSEEKLPFLARLERERRISKSLSHLGRRDGQYPRHHEPYRAFTVPFFDQSLSLGKQYTDSGETTTLLSTTHATADFLKHESNWYLTMNDEGFDDFRVTLGRTDPEGELLGPLRASEYRFGHVAEPRVGLITLPAQPEYGAVVSSYPVGLQMEYDRHRFTGELLPGWEVELYRNNALIGYQQNPIDGQYDFQDVPLLFGSNHFRLVFYGPRGEIREIDQRFDVTQALTRKGEHYYRASVVADEDNNERATFQYDYGLTSNLSTTANVVSIPLQEITGVVQHNYVAAGMTGYWDALLASATVIDDDKSGSALEVDLQTRIDATTIGLTDIWLNDFVSEEYRPVSKPIARRSLVTLNTAIPASVLPRIPVTLGYKRDRFSDGGELVEMSNQFSLSLYGFAMTNMVSHQKITDLPATANGAFNLSTSVANLRLRGSLAYTIKPLSELSNIALTVDPGSFGDYRVNFGLNHSLLADLTEYSARANKISGKYGLSFGATYNSNSEITLGVNLSFGFGYEPRRKEWLADANRVASQGSLSARFFLDANQDGIYNEGDEPLDNIGVRVNGGYSRQRSDEEGILFLTGIQPYNPTNITIAPETLEDPLWRMALDGVQVTPRPGHAIQVDFPIFMSGEIDGTVYLNKNGREFGVGDVTVELVDKYGRVIATTKTAYDGFYILSKAPLGDYRVRVSGKQLQSLGVRAMNEDSLTISSEEPFVSGIDFYLEAE